MSDTVIGMLHGYLGEEVRTAIPLAPYTTLKIGGEAEYFFVAKSADGLISAVAAGRACGIPVTILGGGSNVLIGDRGIRGLVIKNEYRSVSLKGASSRKGTDASDVFVEAGSGAFMNHLVRWSIDQGFSGIEMHLGLPGTVGGAIYMNSKWTRPVAYVGDAVYSADIITPQGETKTVTRDYFDFGYDRSIIQRSGDIVVSVVFRFGRQDPKALWATAQESMEYRRRTQPHGVRSAGCTFRNISTDEAQKAGTGDITSAGYLVDTAGLKEGAVGDAKISPVHANFIVNTGSATAQDVLQLIAQARSRVRTRYGVELVEEIVHLGEF